MKKNINFVAISLNMFNINSSKARYGKNEISSIAQVLKSPHVKKRVVRSEEESC